MQNNNANPCLRHSKKLFSQQQQQQQQKKRNSENFIDAFFRGVFGWLVCSHLLQNFINKMQLFRSVRNLWFHRAGQWLTNLAIRLLIISMATTYKNQILSSTTTTKWSHLFRMMRFSCEMVWIKFKCIFVMHLLSIENSITLRMQHKKPPNNSFVSGIPVEIHSKNHENTRWTWTIENEISLVKTLKCKSPPFISIKRY